MRYELSTNEWSVIGPMPPNKPRGVSRVDDRRILNRIFWVLSAVRVHQHGACIAGNREQHTGRHDG